MVKKAIILVAGFGTRFLPATKAQPKEMLPIVDKPVIQYLVEEAVASGIEDIIFVTGRGKRAIEDHFDNAAELEYFLELRGKRDVARRIREISSLAHFTFVRQKEPRGNGDALLQVRHLVSGDEPVAVLFGDDVVYSKRPCLLQLIDVYKKHKRPVCAIERIPKRNVLKYGVIAGKKIAPRTYEVHGVIEKPSVAEAPSNLIIVGKYIVTPDVFDALTKVHPPSRGKELLLTDGFHYLLKRGEKFYGYEFEGRRYDCGDKLGFLTAVVDFGLRHPEVKSGFRRHLKNLKL